MICSPGGVLVVEGKLTRGCGFWRISGGGLREIWDELTLSRSR